jgi:2-methylcitrate dehydratase PrpD
LMTDTSTAAWLFGTASVALELDEGNKFAKGHPASHVTPAVLSLAAALDSRGADTLVALIAGYEVAARFGEATVLKSGIHPHGNWGIVGAAAACAKLMGLESEAIAAAMDHASGMVLATAFQSALDGNLVRNSWVGACATNAIASARMAAAGLATNTGTAAVTLGATLGSFTAEKITAGLGTRWEVERNYFKRHSACAFTHPPIDACLILRNRVLAQHIDFSHVSSIAVHTHSLAISLNSTKPGSRLAAMFSIPYVVAVALLEGELTPRQHDEPQLVDQRLQGLAAKVSVHHDQNWSDLLPDKRGARVVITFEDGSVMTESVEQPVGDSSHLPLCESDLIVKGEALVDPDQVARIWQYATKLPTVSSLGQISYLLTQQP